MKGIATTFAFIDVLFNLLLGITVLFILSFLLINPPDSAGQIDPPVKLMVTMEWDIESNRDIDLWVRGYDETWVGFQQLDGRYFSLERDDRGDINDYVEINGVVEIIKRNYEVTSFTVLPAGEYFVNTHYYNFTGDQVTVNIKIMSLNPFKIEYEGEVTLIPSQEETVVSFVVDENENIIDLRNDIKIDYISTKPRAGSSYGSYGDAPW